MIFGTKDREICAIVSTIKVIFFYAILILIYIADYARHHLKEKNFLCDKCEFRAYSSADIDKHYKEVNIFFTILIKFKRLVVH